ncbi:MAG: hypothetical protein M1832_004551 [Thelocarpon impressellum]|nr:MAG: hypothetical protein M1832_004551 [Thelocarpon impressellum]
MAGASPSPAPLPPTTNNDGSALAASLKRLSLSTPASTPLPQTPQKADGGLSPRRAAANTRHALPSAQGGAPQPPTPLRRSSSSLSTSDQRRSSTPTRLNKKSSVSSLQNVGGVTPPRPPPSRRSSSQLVSSPLNTMAPRLLASPPPVTAASVAQGFFAADLDVHEHASGAKIPAKTVVILHDSCYGHRYARPRTSRANLSTIVERPERIHASIVGISAAYVRLGSRHADGKHPPHPKHDPKHIPTVPFRIKKSSRSVALTSAVVTAVHGAKWMAELTAMCEAAEAKLALNGKELVRPEDQAAAEEGAKPKLHEGDLYLCRESLDALQGCIGAVCDGVDRVFQGPPTPERSTRAFVCIRPPGHHCSSSYPSGFCWLNNVHVGIAHAAATHGLTHAAIIDFDLHHGDGSQSIAWAHNAKVARLPKNAASSKKTAIGYFSLHDINSYPCELGDEDKVRNASLCVENAHGQTVWNVHLQPWKSEVEFWELYESRYSVLLEKARGFLRTHTDRLRSTPSQPAPRAAIFLSAGFDASEWEGAGMQRHKVNVPTDFYARLTRDIVKLAEEDGLGADGRVVSVLEGGYSDRALASGVLSHLSGLAGGEPMHRGGLDGLGFEMGRRIGVVNGAEAEETGSGDAPEFDPAWWSVYRLEELEALTNPPPPPPSPKKPRTSTPPTYSSPTQSFTAKMASPLVHRSVSNGGGRPGSAAPSRAPTPPPPEVGWATATHELSKLLVPSDRVTTSCRPEELSAEASRTKRERHSAIGLPSEKEAEINPGQRMQLRGRKVQAPSYENQDDTAVLIKARRTTLAGPKLLTDTAVARGTNPEGFRAPTSQSRRRMSTASSVGSESGSQGAVQPVQPANGNVPTTTASRRVSLSRSRPESSMNMRTNGETAVKKARAPSRSRESARPRAPKKQTLVTIAPSPMPQSGRAVPANESKPLSPDEDGRNRDMDSLTAGLTKIKLNVGPRPEEKESKKLVKAKKAVAPKTRKLSPTLEAGKANVSKGASRGLEPKPAPQAASQLQEAPGLEEPELPLQREFIPYELSPPLDAPEIKQEPLVWLPPNTSTPKAKTPLLAKPPTEVRPPTEVKSSPAKIPQPRSPVQVKSPVQARTPSQVKRGDLPVFTANSPIPFGIQKATAQASQVPGAGASGAKDKDIWAVPETPQR